MGDFMAKKEPKPNGRPSAYTKEIADEICVRIAGGESLRSVCRDERMPALSTVLLWAVDDREGFSAQYTRARQAQGYYTGDVIKDFADEVADGTMDPNQARVAIDGYKWIAERQAPRVYGAKQQIDQNIKAEVQTSGVLVAPAATTAQSWEEAAQAQQEQLKADAKAASDGTSES